jgi:hypothetical protein
VKALDPLDPANLDRLRDLVAQRAHLIFAELALRRPLMPVVQGAWLQWICRGAAIVEVTDVQQQSDARSRFENERITRDLAKSLPDVCALVGSVTGSLFLRIVESSVERWDETNRQTITDSAGWAGDGQKHNFN